MDRNAWTAPLAARAEDDELLRPRVARAAEDVHDALERAGAAPKALVLGGSLARGEGTVWRGEGGPAALSDLDLAAVVERDAAARARRALPAIVSGVARRLATDGMIGGFDLGVYTVDDLARQGRRPGTLEYRRHGRVIEGDANVTQAFATFEEGDVPPEEALVLLENRGAELLLAWPGRAGADTSENALRSLYAGMKAVLDGAFAVLVAHGSCPATTKARQAALERWTVEGRSDALRAVLPDYTAAASFWSGMKLAPDAAAIAFRLGVADASDLPALSRRAWREGARAWTACYRVVAARVLGARTTPSTSLAVLAAHASHRARLRRRLRRWWEAGRAVDELEKEGRATWALRTPAERATLALAGAPEHELGACTALLLGAWAEPGATPDWRPAMRRLFPGAPPDRLEWEPCRRAVVKLWDTLILGGARTADEVDDPRPAAGDRLPVEAI